MDFSSIKVFYHSRWSASASCPAPYVSRQPLAGLQGFTSAPRLLELFNRGRSYGSDLKWELNVNKLFFCFFFTLHRGTPFRTSLWAAGWHCDKRLWALRWMLRRGGANIAAP